MWGRTCGLIGLVLLLAAAPAAAQQGSAGQVADSAVGQIGQRQAREQPAAGIEPMTRVNARIQNRVQSRVRNRIDRFYDPQANAASPFQIAGDQAQTASRSKRR